MNLSPRRREEPEVNLTPLIDVVFLMLIFFMVSTTFVSQARLNVTLPESEQASSSDDDDGLALTINAQGRMFLDGDALVNSKLETVRRALDQAVGERDPKAVRLVIQADADARHQAVITVLDAAGQLGLSRVGMAASATGEQ
ncbi:ExbD/TolR family protein [Arhodomonas sp. AD133]|uniref:ExbD/TolR family protein n=1 Tax=Arhodomonas sp. AD133 TaxID=3415009 RepID=UPI003EBD9267